MIWKLRIERCASGSCHKRANDRTSTWATCAVMVQLLYAPVLRAVLDEGGPKLGLCSYAPAPAARLGHREDAPRDRTCRRRDLGLRAWSNRKHFKACRVMRTDGVLTLHRRHGIPDLWAKDDGTLGPILRGLEGLHLGEKCRVRKHDELA